GVRRCPGRWCRGSGCGRADRARQPVLRDDRRSRPAPWHRADHRSEDRRLQDGTRSVRLGRRPRRGARDRPHEDRATPRARHSVSTVKRAVALHWPALLVSSGCVGMTLAVRFAVPMWAAALLAFVGLCVAVALDGSPRVAAFAFALAALGLGWG